MFLKICSAILEIIVQLQHGTFCDLERLKKDFGIWQIENIFVIWKLDILKGEWYDNEVVTSSHFWIL